MSAYRQYTVGTLRNNMRLFSSFARVTFSSRSSSSFRRNPSGWKSTRFIFTRAACPAGGADSAGDTSETPEYPFSRTHIRPLVLRRADIENISHGSMRPIKQLSGSFYEISSERELDTERAGGPNTVSPSKGEGREEVLLERIINRFFSTKLLGELAKTRGGPT